MIRQQLFNIETLEEAFLEGYIHTLTVRYHEDRAAIAISATGATGVLAVGTCDWGEADDNLGERIEEVLVAAMQRAKTTDIQFRVTHER